MAKRTIGECFYRIRNGANIQQGKVDGGIPITRIETIANDLFNRDRMGYAGITDAAKYSEYVLDDGDLLVSHINSLQYLGRAVLYRKQGNETIIHGMNLLGLKAERTIIDPAFACYCFRSQSFRKQIMRIAKKSVNQASFSVSDFSKIVIDVPDLLSQTKIVSLLDLSASIIQARQCQLRTLDTLIKARFVEMFGAFPENPMGWETGTIRDVVSDVRYGSSRPAVEGGRYPYLRMNNITYGGELDLTDTKQIDVPENELEKCTVRRGDVLFNRTNSKELVGKTCVYNRDEMMVLAGFVIRIRLNNQMLPDFLSAFLNTDFSKAMLLGMCKTAIGQANINAQEMQGIQLYIPPIERQAEFVRFKEQIDKSKVAVQAALNKDQLLFDSLMQQYFG